MSDFGFSFGTFPFDRVFWAVFGIIAAIIAAVLLKGLAQWIKNNNSPRLTENALVTGKRTDTGHHSSANMGDISGAHGYHSSFHTWYYATFQLENGERMELMVRDTVYGQLAEGDQGKLTYQGTRFLDFDRKTD